MQTIKIKIKNNNLVEHDLGLLFLNVAILSLLLPVFIEILTMDIKKTNYRSIDSIPSQSKQGASYDSSRGITFKSISNYDNEYRQ